MGIGAIFKAAAKYIPGKTVIKNVISKAKSSKVGSILKSGASKIKSTKIGSKVGSIFSSKTGKIGLAVTGIGLLATGGYFLYDKLFGEKEPQNLLKEEPNVIPDEEIEKQPVQKEEPKDESKEVEKETQPDKTAPNKVEDKDKKEEVKPDKEEPKDESKEVEKETQPDKTDPKAVEDNDKEKEVKPEAPKEHIVVKGDNVWNIAKAHLKEMHKDDPTYKPTNAEILKHTKELMGINNLHFEADNYRVMIHPGDKLKLVA